MCMLLLSPIIPYLCTFTSLTFMLYIFIYEYIIFFSCFFHPVIYTIHMCIDCCCNFYHRFAVNPIPLHTVASLFPRYCFTVARQLYNFYFILYNIKCKRKMKVRCHLSRLECNIYNTVLFFFFT